MNDIAGLGRFLLVAGLVIAAVGIVLVAAQHVPWLDRLGRLPGDIFFQRGNTTVLIPIASSIVVSILLTLILNLVLRMRNCPSRITTRAHQPISQSAAGSYRKSHLRDVHWDRSDARNILTIRLMVTRRRTGCRRRFFIL